MSTVVLGPAPLAPLVAASWRAVRPVRIAGIAAATVVLVGVTAPWQDSGHAVPVMHGVALLLACLVALCTDDPAADVAAATPYPRHVRTLARLAVGTAVAVPAYLLASWVAEARFDPTPLMVLGPEALTSVIVAAAVGSLLRRRGMHAPAYPTVLIVLLLTFALARLPRGYAVIDPQPWGPPVEAALIRWAALALLAVAALAWALRDPVADRAAR